MQIQRKRNGSAALRIAGRLIFSFPCLLAAGGIAALVVSLLFCHASSLDLVNSFPRLLPVCFACKIEERSRTDGGKKEPLRHDIHRSPRKNHGRKEQLELNTLAEYVERIFTEHFEGGQISMKAERTLAVQIPAELFERLKEYLAARNLKQKQFLIQLIENALDDTEAE